MEVNGLWIRGDESLHSGSGEALHQGIERERERERVFFKFLGFNLFFSQDLQPRFSNAAIGPTHKNVFENPKKRNYKPHLMQNIAISQDFKLHLLKTWL